MSGGGKLLREYLSWRGVALVVGGGLVMAIIGPFGTYLELDPIARFAYWVVALGGVGFFMHLVIPLALRSPRYAALPRLAVLAAASTTAALPGLVVIYLLEVFLRGSNIAGVDFVWLWFFIAIMGFMIAPIHFHRDLFAVEADTPGPEPATGGAETGRPSFLRNLPAEIGDELVSLTMQDHYLSVTTSKGTALIHLRFSDALEELAARPGARIHRSHWVAASAVERIVRHNGKAVAVLNDGRKLPISRPYLAAARRLVREDGRG